MITYQEYLEQGRTLMGYFFSNTFMNYVDSRYTNSEGRINSVDAEKDLLLEMENNPLLEELPIIDECKDDCSHNDYWYDYYKYIGTDFGDNDIKIIVPKTEKTRHWFDVSIVCNGYFYPINIKITNGNTNDNLFGLMTLKYVMFGYDFVGGYQVQNVYKVSDESEFSKEISAKLSANDSFGTEEPRDYFFASLNKETAEFTFCSFLNMKDEYIKTNPKNLFQANLSLIENGINYEKLNLFNNVYSCISKYYEYVSKKAGPYIYLEENYKRIFGAN